MAKKSRPTNDEESLVGQIKSEFPKHPLESAIRIAKAIEDANGGKPYPPTDIAIALGLSPGSSDFRMMISSAHKYGVVEGSYKSSHITLTPLGTRIVAPTSAEDEPAAKVEAVLRPETFKRIYEHFVGKKLPDDVFFQNTVVREFGVPKEHAAKCVQIFIGNATSVGLTRQAATGTWLAATTTGQSASQSSSSEQTDGSKANHQDSDPDRANDPRVPTDASQNNKGPKQGIFIGHGRNKRPLQQLEKILSSYGIPFKIATDEANRFRPISEKVAEIMHQCGAAILIFTADEEFRTPDGETVWRPSENVVHELGAASILYGGRIIIFKEKGVNLPSNFSGIGYISFEKDQLEHQAMPLFKELVTFGLVKISVG
ncbi:MAG: hypothetical protein JWM57_1609 [Phycisphaerales bacterium]|nr:hypothetical protein [Phycisphaerales bacterium]